MTTEPLVTHIGSTLGVVGSSFYFTPETIAVGKGYGLDGMRWYVVGRGGVLGDVEPAVITSAFGYFHPSSIAKLWTTAREKVGAREAGARYMVCAGEHGRARFARVLGLESFNEAAERVVEAAYPAAYALFAGIAAEPLASDTAARAMQLAAVLREFRGSAHLVAVIASGLTPELAHYIRRPEMYKTFGYDEANPPTVTDAHRAALAEADRLTDRLVGPAFAVLDQMSLQALADGADAMKGALEPPK